MTICNHCRYERSDCKGIKGGIECEYYAKPDVFNARALAEENEKLREDLKIADEAYDGQGELLLEAEDKIERLISTVRMLEDRVETLKAENEELKAVKSRKMCDLCYHAHRIEGYSTLLYCGSRNGVVNWDGGKDCADFEESDTE